MLKTYFDSQVQTLSPITCKNDYFLASQVFLNNI